MSVQRVLITGASGFVGSNITRALLDAGYEVVALDQDFSAAPVWFTPITAGLTVLEGDANALPAITVDYMIHAAAITASADEIRMTPEQHYRANLEPALHVLEWAAQHGIRRAVFVSSSGVYNNQRAETYTEESPAHPLGLYADAKHAIERLIVTLRKEYNRDVMVVRFGGIYGPEELPRASRPRVSLVAKMVHSALNKGILAVDELAPPREWTFAPDIGRALVTLLQARTLKHALYNVSASMSYSPRQIAAAIRLRLPDITVTSALPLSQPLRGVLSNQRLTEETGFQDWTALEHGIARTIAWQQAQQVQPAQNGAAQ